jgi:hypothetical protein
MRESHQKDKEEIIQAIDRHLSEIARLRSDVSAKDTLISKLSLKEGEPKSKDELI